MTRSPSTTRTMRNTPWVAGCCGAMLMLKSMVSNSRSSSGCWSIATLLAPFFRHDFDTGAGWDVAGAAHLGAQLRALPFFQRRQRVVFAQREVVQHVVRQQDGHQVGMALEHDAEHV